MGMGPVRSGSPSRDFSLVQSPVPREHRPADSGAFLSHIDRNSSERLFVSFALSDRLLAGPLALED